MEFSSPIQCRNKHKIVVAEDEAISLWEVNSMPPQRLHNVDLSGKELRALVLAGIVLKIPTFGETANSVYANGDSVFAGVIPTSID
ncbi:unnamed protein product [Calypogeia fissa]